MIGLYGMAAFGLRTFSGLTVGLVVRLTNIHISLLCSGSAFVLCTFLLRWRLNAGDRASA